MKAFVNSKWWKYINWIMIKVLISKYKIKQLAFRSHIFYLHIVVFIPGLACTTFRTYRLLCIFEEYYVARVMIILTFRYFFLLSSKSRHSSDFRVLRERKTYSVYISRNYIKFLWTWITSNNFIHYVIVYTPFYLIIWCQFSPLI